jgi:hypothetical protein
MTPYDRARAVYASEPCARTFEEDLRLHLKFSYVYSTPDYFIMGRPVAMDSSYKDITDPLVQFSEPDAWWVYLASGDLNSFFTIKPFDLPYVGWERGNKARFYRADRVSRLCQRTSTMNLGALPTHLTCSLTGD